MAVRTLRPARSVALLATALAVLAALLVAPSSTAVAPEDDPRAEQAKAALARVQELLDDKPGKAPAALSRHEAPDVTIAMRDLFLFKDALDGEERQDAERILARPTDGGGPTGEPKYINPEASCSNRVCVHYVEPSLLDLSSDAVDPADNNGNGVPDFVDAVRNAVTRSHNQMRKFGYRAPLPDGTRGGNQKPDIYLGDIGNSMGVFGYAVPEGQQSGWGWGAWGYLVLDNDYAEFCSGGCSTTTALKLMRATAAHEYFHAVQFGYDFAEDRWFMEATATWIEDEVFDGVNDNVNFLFASPSALQTPRVPIDHQDAVPYGNWIWFRYLSERFGRNVVLNAWKQADGYTGGGRTPKDHYSVKAVMTAVKVVSGKRGRKFWNKEFAKFADANRRPKRFYSEARANRYPAAPLTGRAVLSRSSRKAVRKTKLSRLASASYRVKPAKGLRKGWKLRVRIDGNTAKQGGFAIASIKRKGGGINRVGFNLGSNGRKAKTLPFGRSKVKWVEVTIVSASTRNRCWLAGTKSNPDWSDPRVRNTCQGVSKDNGRPQKLTVRAIR